jgi:hypothetical protein
LSKASREGLVDRTRPEALWKMQECITKMRGAAADVFMYLYCKIPYIYMHLMTVLVRTSMPSNRTNTHIDELDELALIMLVTFTTRFIARTVELSRKC